MLHITPITEYWLALFEEKMRTSTNLDLAAGF